jgi:hypothetical protein
MSELHIILTPTGWEVSFVSPRGNKEEITEDLSLSDLADVIASHDYSSEEPVVLSAGQFRYLVEQLQYNAKEEVLISQARRKSDG